MHDVYGLSIESHEYRPQRDCVTVTEPSIAGNVALRVGRENIEGHGWTQLAVVMLTPAEAQALGEELLEAARTPA